MTGTSFEFKNSDKITYTVTTEGENLFDVSTSTSCTDSYLKLTAKDSYANTNELPSENFLTITSGGKSACVTSGGYDYSMLFKVNKRTNDVSNKLLMFARMANDVTWNYALKVTGLSDNQRENAINIGLGVVDTDNPNMLVNNWTTADAWYKYHININYYTNTVTVGVTNMTTGEEVFTPYVTTFDPIANNNKLSKLDPTVTTVIRRYGADYAIDEVTDSRDIFICRNALITADDTTVTATVQFANDVLASAYNPAYNGTDYEPVIILAVYDSNGVLTGIDSVKPTIERTKGVSDDLTWQDVTVSVPKAEDYDNAKMYIWDSMNGMTPFCEPVNSNSAEIS